MEQIQPGEVLVLAMPKPSPVALIGELLATQAKVRGAAAILVDAAVRDVEELVELGLPIWTRYIRVRGATKAEIGQLNMPVTVGNTGISPGDVVVLDTDGAVCVKQERLQDVLQKAEARLEKETRMRTRLEAGETTYDIHGLRENVEKR
jgi:4-hydroxy-4-methyl-2-oxoglutarate aldolase